MFQRLQLADGMGIFTLIAFVTALSIYVTIFIRALRMRRPQIERLAQLPFADESVARHHDAN